jgi:hypothetical protein
METIIACWHAATGFLWGNPALAVMILLLMSLTWRRKKAPTKLADPEPCIQQPHPYFSAAAMNDFRERSAFGDGAMAEAAELHRSMQGANSHGEPPFFEE